MMSVHCNVVQHQKSTKTRSPRLCVLRCVVQPDCVAVKMNLSNGRCFFLKADDVIIELGAYDVSQYVIVYPAGCTTD